MKIILKNKVVNIFLIITESNNVFNITLYEFVALIIITRILSKNVKLFLILKILIK